MQKSSAGLEETNSTMLFTTGMTYKGGSELCDGECLVQG
jgi:hypothetical protein